MEGTPEPGPRRRDRRALLVLIVAAVVVAAGVLVWWGFLRPRTIAEVLAFDHFQPGSAVTIAGTITGVFRQNTSYGPKVILALDHESECNGTGQVYGDPNATYVVGETFQTTLHFQSYTIAGNPAVTAPELACPFPAEFMAFHDVIDVVSRLQGVLLAYNGSQAGGWQDYTLFTQNGERYNASGVPATLETPVPLMGTIPRFPSGSSLDSAANWDAFLTVLQYGMAGGQPSRYFPLADRMTSLQAGSSANGSLRYDDANGNRVLDDGDRFDIRLPPATSPTSWGVYLLQLGSNSSYFGGRHLFFAGPEGPLEPLLSSMLPVVDFAYAGTQTGPPFQSSIRVASVPIGPPLPLGTTRYMLTIQSGVAGYSQVSGNVASLPKTVEAGVTLSYVDSNGDGLLNAGDRFTVTGAANQSGITLFVLGPEGGGGRIYWIVGFGMPLSGIRVPTLTVEGNGPWAFRVNETSWSPELALNRTVRATVLENGTAVLTNASLVNGTLGMFADGSLSFTDADGNGYLSTGDYFTLTGNTAAWYELDVTFFFGMERVAAFT